MVTQFNFSNLDSWPQLNTATVIMLGSENRRAGGGRRNNRHRQVTGASMGAGEGELGEVKA